MSIHPIVPGSSESSTDGHIAMFSDAVILRTALVNGKVKVQLYLRVRRRRDLRSGAKVEEKVVGEEQIYP